MRTSGISQELVAEAERLAEADFEHVAGKVIITTKETCISGLDHEYNLKRVFGEYRMIVERTTSRDALHHWRDEFLEPYWHVTPAKHYPEMCGLEGCGGS